MTQNSELIALTERCEAASGADRELDAAIGRAVLGSDRAFIKAQMPAYTASLDAAMTLAPEGWCVASFEWWPMRAMGAGVTLREVREFGEPFPSTGYDETCGDARARGCLPALAVAAAALRARARSEAQ